MRNVWPFVGALVGGGIAFVIAWTLASEDVNKLGDWRGGGETFIGAVSAIGMFLGFFTAVRLTRGAHVKRDGFTLVHRRIAPTASGYRDIVTISVADLVDALREVGYDPSAEACDETGARVGRPLDPTTPIAGTNVALVDRGVRGWLRLQLPIPVDGQERALGLLEIWSKRGESTEEFALFTLRALEPLVGGIMASRESSVLGEDPVANLTAGLGERPVHRRT